MCTPRQAPSTQLVFSAVIEQALLPSLISSSAANTSHVYPSKSPLAVTSTIAEVGVLWVSGLLGLCLLPCTALYCGYLIGTSWHESVSGDFRGVVKAVQAGAKEIAATSESCSQIMAILVRVHEQWHPYC